MKFLARNFDLNTHTRTGTGITVLQASMTRCNLWTHHIYSSFHDEDVGGTSGGDKNRRCQDLSGEEALMQETTDMTFMQVGEGNETDYKYGHSREQKESSAL